jgi:hypothetical protein
MSDDTRETTEGEVVVALNPSRRSSPFVTPNDIAKAIRNGWQIDPERKRLYFEALDRAVLNDLQAIEDPHKRAIAAASCARVLVAEQGQALKDVHHKEDIDQQNGVMILKQQRAEMGLPNDSLAVILPPTTQTPMPAWMERMKGECPQ